MKKIYYTIFYLLTLSVITYLGVDTFYQVVEARLMLVGTGEKAMKGVMDNKRSINRPLGTFQTIMDRNLFGSVGSKSGEAVPPVELETLEPTSLKIALLGTVAGDQENAVAVIEDKKKKKQDLYKVGDSVQDALIKKIIRGKVVLKVGDKDEILTMEEVSSSPLPLPSPSPPSTRRTVSGNQADPRSRNLERTISIRRTDIDESLQDINALLSQARILPHFENGEADGLAVTGIKAGSIFMRMGLRNGDIVHSINDNTIATPDDILSIYSEMQSNTGLSIQIKRGSRERTINYRFLE